MKKDNNIIKVGTRKSTLALIQTNKVIEQLEKLHPEFTYEKVIITTKGDKEKNKAISQFGGKAVFVEEFENALLDGTIDIAVHSAKDMPNPCKKGLIISGVLERACVQDVLIYEKGKEPSKDDKFVIGTSSLRRQYQIKALYPNAVCKDLRGNIGTRINRLKEGLYDAIILAAAGIERQGLNEDSDLQYKYLSVDEMLPAAGQAIIAVESRENSFVNSLVNEISHKESMTKLTAERMVLTKLNAGCHEPVGVLCNINKEQLEIKLMEVKAGKVVRKQVAGNEQNLKQLVEELCE